MLSYNHVIHVLCWSVNYVETKHLQADMSYIYILALHICDIVTDTEPILIDTGVKSFLH